MIQINFFFPHLNDTYTAMSDFIKNKNKNLNGMSVTHVLAI